MKRLILIEEEAMERLLTGKPICGELRLDLMTRVITFKVWQRKSKKRKKDELVRQLESGWVKESAEKYKLFISIYKKLGLPRIMHIIDRESKQAKDALFDKELIEFV